MRVGAPLSAGLRCGAMAEERRPVLLGLRDAPMAGPCREAPAWATNKLGGSADALPALRPAEPRCGACGAALAHLVQVYCPLRGLPCHRLANVFACPGTGCWGQPRSWKVLRSQCLQTQEKEARGCSLKQKQESNFSAKDWCDEADDWGVCDGAESPACALQLLGLKEVTSSSSSREAECASQFEQLCLSEATDVSGSLDMDLPVREDMVTATSAPVFHPYYISVVDEEDYAGFLDTDHADELWKEYQQREGVDLEHLMSESFAAEGDKEKYEKSEVKSGDHMFHKFMKKISVCHEQILRYSWGGQPLFITCPPANFNEGIPACSNCGSKRIFEFQLMPALVSMLQSNSDLSVEFGTVIVYTCEKSCWPLNHQTPLEEFLFVQEDPDQKLFK
ncbi:programmed cell death protein 2-like [Oxyura jamaicensis]|uniref:programmed cell death protein 2-like n=1 Tax=Oxyura jamaicensis TaxID=8884 RepID=UPI0015A6A617|nr:programmed cell death protein 2-like [Oxyura jamaicensis]